MGVVYSVRGLRWPSASQPYYVRFAQTPWQAHRHMENARRKRLRKNERRFIESERDMHARYEQGRQRWLNALNSCGGSDPVDGYEVVSATLEGDGPTLRVEVVQPVG